MSATSAAAAAVAGHHGLSAGAIAGIAIGKYADFAVKDGLNMLQEVHSFSSWQQLWSISVAVIGLYQTSSTQDAPSRILATLEAVLSNMLRPIRSTCPA